MRKKANRMSSIVQIGSVLPYGEMKYAESIITYDAETSFHLAQARNPAIKTLRGSANMPNIQSGSGLTNRAIELPKNAARKPILGPRIMPSMASKYIPQFRHNPKDTKYKTTCNAAKTAIRLNCRLFRI